MQSTNRIGWELGGRGRWAFLVVLVLAAAMLAQHFATPVFAAPINPTFSATIPAGPTVTNQAYTVSWSVTGANPGSPTGTVTVRLNSSGGTLLCSASSSMVSSCSVTDAVATRASDSPHTIWVGYSGDANFNAASTTGNHSVNKANTTITITSVTATNPDFSFFGESFTVSYNVTATNGLTPTGPASSTVSVSIPNATGCTGNVTAATGNGSCQGVETTSVWVQVLITATFIGDSNFNASSPSAATSWQIHRAVTDISITNAAELADNSVVGEPVTVKWSLGVTSGAGIPGGTIEVNEGIGCIVPAAQTQCDINWTLASGTSPYFITVVYSGDSNFEGDSSTGVNHTVDKAPTTVTITNAATLASTPSVLTQKFDVNWQVDVAPPGNVLNVVGAHGPSGTVQVTVNGQFGCFALVADQTCKVTGLTQGLVSIVATYVGDDDFEADASDPASHTIQARAATQTTISNAAALSSTSSIVGDPYTVSWHVDAFPTPFSGTGIVTVTAGLTVVCTGSVGAGGDGSCNASSTVVGSQSLKARYEGDANFFPSTSPTVSHQVTKANTTTVITNTATLDIPTLTGEAFAVQWQVTVDSPGAAFLTGNVTVKMDGNTACSAPVANLGCSITSKLTAGTHSIVVSYAGNTVANGSSSAAHNHQINAPVATTITITNAAQLENNTTARGVAFLVTWSTTPPAGTLAGNVTVKIGRDVGCTVAVSVGSCMVTADSAGRKAITAAYEGAPGFSPSKSASITHRVTR